MRQKDRKTEQKGMKSPLKQLQLPKNSEKRKSGTYGTEIHGTAEYVDRRMREGKKYV